MFLLSTLDSAGIPVLAGVDALVAYLAYKNPAVGLLGAAMAVLGSLIGCFFLFGLARKGGERYLDKYTMSGRGATLRSWFVRYGLMTVFIPALLPIPMPLKIFVLSAGALGVHPVTFGLVLLVARSLRYFGMAWLGTQLGDQTVPYLKGHAGALLLLAAGLFVFLFLLMRLLSRRRRPMSREITGH